MRVRFWGTRGSLPVAPRADVFRRKVARALVAADGRRFADEAEAWDFAGSELDFATGRGYGGATSCVEVEGAPDGSFIVCDMGSGLRDFGLDAARRCAAGHARIYNVFLSHLHWDHIMGFPFFVAAFDPGATIVIHGGHADLEKALRRQQEEISFPVAFDWLRADIRFRTLVPGETYRIAGMDVRLIEQCHSHASYGYRFEHDGKAVIYSTDAEHRIDDMENERAFEAFFRGADVVVCDTMYSLAESVTMKADWGHSSNLVAVDLCHAAGADRLVLFHHEPTYVDEDIQRMHAETIRYEEINRQDRPPLTVVCAYDGLELDV
ncbi:MBL fold metallo-hydrolase [Sphingomonas solaris]|uniref:MBL fold metallo-hydrolase n=1 Tax=Alterirhizorhabdus solaris TaxID=2529389 RepID=A0A558QXU3_9SPHN|nr:MBL fold metallo-hydrolase [Sphingomonas solaris]TVV71877.1 MBL fold metallo-hydrolase [Sphingomonas solaris]